MGKTCQNAWCQQHFEVYDEDRLLMAKFDVQKDPDHCPTCRHDHRRMFSPILKLHHRKSDLSGDSILSIFHPRHTFPVYAVKEWWSDAWDALSYGRHFDFSRPFFEQFAELYSAVPKMASNNENTENCEYSYSCGNAKNVYYSRTVHRSDDIYYSQYITGYNNSLCDCLVCQRSSFLYECVHCFNCSSCSYLIKSSNCGDCHYSTDLVGCTDCLFCHNLRNKSHYIDNKQVTKEEYERIKADVFTGRYADSEKNLLRFANVYAKTIWKNLNTTNCENCVGDTLTNCVNCFQCFNCVNSQDARYCCRLTPSEKCVTVMDLTSGGIGELIYNCVGLGGGNYFMRMCYSCRLCSHCTYCTDCFTSKDCFGCTGLRNKRYRIFNVQYSREEYEALASKIVAAMRDSGEWGKFFPLSLSPFAYNEGNNSEEYSLSQDDVLQRGWVWHLSETEVPSGTLIEEWPEDISTTDDTVIGHVFTCSASRKPYKIIPQELAFYRAMHFPIPHEHPDIRMARRRKFLTPSILFPRQCFKCHQQIQSTYSSDRPEIVYCEQCYRLVVYEYL